VRRLSAALGLAVAATGSSATAADKPEMLKTAAGYYASSAN
jgi:hypothetical protein